MISTEFGWALYFIVPNFFGIGPGDRRLTFFYFYNIVEENTYITQQFTYCGLLWENCSYVYSKISRFWWPVTNVDATHCTHDPDGTAVPRRSNKYNTQIYPSFISFNSYKSGFTLTLILNNTDTRRTVNVFVFEMKHEIWHLNEINTQLNYTGIIIFIMQN